MICILQIIALIFYAYIAFSHKKRNVLITVFVHNFTCLILSVVINDFSAVYSYILVNLRSFIFLYQDRLKKNQYTNAIPVGICILHIILGISSVERWYQIPTIIGPIVLTLSFWFENNRQRMRAEQSFSDAMWLIYNAFAGLYILCITRVMMITISLIAIYKNKNKIE